MVKDAPVAAIPTGALYDSVDFMLDKPGIAYKRGGTSYADFAAGTTASYYGMVHYADFPTGGQLLAWSKPSAGNSKLFRLLTGSAPAGIDTGEATNLPPISYPKLLVDKLVVPLASGVGAPPHKVTWDGATLTNAVWGGTPPSGKYVEVYKSRIALAGRVANPDRVFFSPAPDPEDTWDVGNAYIAMDHPVTGLASLQNTLIVFSAGHTERITGADPPPDTDMDRAVIGAIGCTDARSIAVYQDNAIFANPSGVYLTNGAGFQDLTEAGLVQSYWQSLFSGYDSATWVIAAGMFRGYYFVSILDATGALVDAMMCNVARRSWWRLSGAFRAMAYTTSSGVNHELYLATRAAPRVHKASGIFLPTSSNPTDADGGAVLPQMQLRLVGQGVGVKQFGFGRVTYDLRAASGVSTMAVTVAEGVEANTFSAVPESPLAETTQPERPRFTISRRAQGVNLKFAAQTTSPDELSIYAVEVEQMAIPTVQGGV
jgi:hypothetical protein